MEIIVFTLVGIGLYFAADRVLSLIERWRGRPLANRSIVYFVIFLVMALIAFEIIGQLSAVGDSGQ